MTVIKVCLGSSCYIRGNDKILALLENYVSEKGKNINIELSGCRCTNSCQDGPHIFIDNKKYNHLTEAELLGILEAL